MIEGWKPTLKNCRVFIVTLSVKGRAFRVLLSWSLELPRSTPPNCKLCAISGRDLSTKMKSWRRSVSSSALPAFAKKAEESFDKAASSTLSWLSEQHAWKALCFNTYGIHKIVWEQGLFYLPRILGSDVKHLRRLKCLTRRCDNYFQSQSQAQSLSEWSSYAALKNLRAIQTLLPA